MLHLDEEIGNVLCISYIFIQELKIRQLRVCGISNVLIVSQLMRTKLKINNSLLVRAAAVQCVQQRH